MKSKQAYLFILLILGVAFFNQNCSKSESDPSPEGELEGDRTGTATNKANSSDKKALSLSITSTSNPIAGTYKLVNATGKVSGSALGLILSMTFKPDASGTTYTFSGSEGNDAKTITGTMTGVESGTAVIYDVVLSK